MKTFSKASFAQFSSAGKTIQSEQLLSLKLWPMWLTILFGTKASKILKSLQETNRGREIRTHHWWGLEKCSGGEIVELPSQDGERKNFRLHWHLWKMRAKKPTKIKMSLINRYKGLKMSMERSTVNIWQQLTKTRFGKSGKRQLKCSKRRGWLQ